MGPPKLRQTDCFMHFGGAPTMMGFHGNQSSDFLNADVLEGQKQRWEGGSRGS